MPVPVVKRDPVHGFRYYADPPPLDLRRLPDDTTIVLPPDGGFWIVDALTGIRYRRITMADLPKNSSWNTRKAAEDDDEAEAA